MELVKLLNKVLFAVFMANFVMLTSCSFDGKRQESNSSDEVEVEYLEEEEEPYQDEQFFLPNDDGYVYFLDENYLQKLFEWNYDSCFSSYETFKELAVSGKINLNYKTIQCDTCVFYYFEERFKLDNHVMEYYNNNSFDTFKGMYCQAKDSTIANDSLLSFKGNPDAMKKNELLTIAYCLWLNGYDYYPVGCFNYYYFRKRDYEISGEDSSHSEAAGLGAK